MPKVERVGDNVIVRGVPIFDEHEDSSRPDPFKKVDAALLKTFVDNTNKRLVSEKELPVVFAKHTPDEGDGGDNPDVKGGYSNLRVEDFTDGNGTRKAAFADLRIPASEWKDATTYQRRSVEAYPISKVFDTLVLLGSTRPARDLGPLTPPAKYAHEKNCVRYEMNDEQGTATMSMDAAALAPTMKIDVESLQALASMVKAVVKEVLNESFAEEAAAQNAEAEAIEEPGTDLNDNGEVEPGAEQEVFDEEKAAEENDDMGDEKKKKEEYSSRDLAVKYARQEKELAELKAKFADIEKKERAERYAKKVTELQSEGFAVELKEEMPYLLETLTTDTQRDAHIEKLRKIAKHSAPTFGGRIAYGHAEDPVKYQGNSNADPRNGKLTPDQAKQAQMMAAKEGITYDAARAKVLNGAA